MARKKPTSSEDEAQGRRVFEAAHDDDPANTPYPPGGAETSEPALRPAASPKRKTRPAAHRIGDDNVIGAFGEDQGVRLTGLSRYQLRRWDRDGFLRASYAPENRRQPYSRIYSFRDIVSLRVLNDLRNETGCSLQHLREVAKRLAHLGDAKWIATTLYVLGKRVVFEDPRTHHRQEVVSGQQVLHMPLRVVISSTRKAVLEMNRRGSAEVGKVIRSRFISENQPVFAGTRIPVAAVKRLAAAGYEPAAIVREYPSLTPEDVKAGLAYRDERAAA
jgi:DNA-binding transcriptional MerR regulator